MKFKDMMVPMGHKIVVVLCFALLCSCAVKPPIKDKPHFDNWNELTLQMYQESYQSYRTFRLGCWDNKDRDWVFDYNWKAAIIGDFHFKEHMDVLFDEIFKMNIQYDSIIIVNTFSPEIQATEFSPFRSDVIVFRGRKPKIQYVIDEHDNKYTITQSKNCYAFYKSINSKAMVVTLV